MVKRWMGAALALAALPIAILPGAERAAAAEGHWAVKTGAEPVILGYIVPGFSTNEFVAYWITCANGAFTGVVDFPIEEFATGQTYTVQLIIDGTSHRLPATAVFSDMQQYSLLESDLERDAPPFSDLATARTIRVNVNDRGFDLSTENLRDAMETFLAACPPR